MAKALMGFVDGEFRSPTRMSSDNARLRARIAELEVLVEHLMEDNDRLRAEHALVALQHESNLQPA